MARKSRRAKQTEIAPNAQPSDSLQANEQHLRKYRAAAYTRLSVYDLGCEDSDTMENQIKLVTSYISRQPDLVLTDTYVDNGWTGTSFDRPEFKRLLEDIQEGKIDCIVVKDLSRFGRNYLETAYYLQTVFVQEKVRFVSVNDGFDSLSSDCDSLEVSIKNIINDYYSKDLSRKVSSSLDIKRSQGVHSWGHAAYGYIRAADNPSQLQIDTEVSPYVRLIFHWAQKGVPLSKIASNLTELHAPTYQRLIHIRKNGNTRRTGSDAWNTTSIKQMLLNQTYCGDFVYQKSYFRKYDPANGHWIPEDQWNIIPDAHPAYIDRNDFLEIKKRILEMSEQRSQVLKERQSIRNQLPNLFNGIIYCGECGRKMSFRREINHKIYTAYQCHGKENQHRQGHPQLTINAETLQNIVLTQINLHIQCAVDIDALLKRVSATTSSAQLKKEQEHRLNQLKGNAARIILARSRAFEDLAEAVIDEDTYRSQMDVLTSKSNAITNQIQELEQLLSGIDTYFSTDNKWLQTFSQMGKVEELTPELIHLLIYRIDVFQDKSIRITFNFTDWMAPLLKVIDAADSADTTN